MSCCPGTSPPSAPDWISVRLHDANVAPGHAALKGGADRTVTANPLGKVDYRAHRGLGGTMFQRLAQGEWVERQQNLMRIRQRRYWLQNDGTAILASWRIAQLRLISSTIKSQGFVTLQGG
jgi:hypothetical protein